MQQLGHQRPVVIVDEQRGIADGLRDRSRRPGDHRHAEMKRLEQRDAEALMLRQAEERVGGPVPVAELLGVRPRSMRTAPGASSSASRSR